MRPLFFVFKPQAGKVVLATDFVLIVVCAPLLRYPNQAMRPKGSACLSSTAAPLPASDFALAKQCRALDLFKEARKSKPQITPPNTKRMLSHPFWFGEPSEKRMLRIRPA